MQALIVVDCQVDFTPGGSLPVARGDEIAARINTFILKRREEFSPIVATKCFHPDDDNFPHFSRTPDFINTWPKHCVAGTPGAFFHPNLRAYDPLRPPQDQMPDMIMFDQIFLKGQDAAAYSGFEGVCPAGKLDNYLRGLDADRVLVVGLATDYCVKATALDAVRLGYGTSVFTDLCAGVAPDTTMRALDVMETAGVHIDMK